MQYNVVHPICCTQKIAVYETKTRFYLVGSNNSQTRFRILKIDRTEPTEVNVIDDKVEYNQREIRELLKMIDFGNKPKLAKSYDKGHGLRLRCSAFGILGLVRFLEGYYIVLIAKRRRVALIGGHAIYKIDDTVMIPIANEQARSRMGNPDELRYLRIFQNVDLASNFYFSYSYDLTQTLQYNMAPNYGLPSKYCKRHEETEDEEGDWDPHSESTEDAQSIDLPQTLQFSNNKQEHKKDGVELSSLSGHIFPDMGTSPTSVKPKEKTKVFRGTATEKFVWNSYLLENLKDKVHPDWLLNITHGFVGQSNICVYGKPLYVTLIARRSNKFAGTRFLKRGANDEGFVANDVETEQVCHDASTISLQSGKYTSYTQLRGSAPFFWSQDTSPGRITPKPQILVDRADPYFSVTANHFNACMARCGTPLIVLNLVKIKEKKAHEQILSGLLKESIDYLNQFLPPEHAIRYYPWDMARVTKSKEDKVIEILAGIAEKVMKETGFFHSGPQIYCNQLRNHPSFAGMKGYGYTPEHPGLRQTGILRVNCVDCLDRTNTAQFMVGKCALGFQLYALGVVESPILQFDSDAVRILEELFEAHGDTLALQYGGSQMVHRIRTYRKIAPWTSYSRDIMQTVSRYYSNAFTDTDRQQAINLFLGTFRPSNSMLNIWDMVTDYYLHHSSTINLGSHNTRKNYTKWWQDEVFESLPLAWEELAKREVIENEVEVEEHEETLDLFSEYYRPSELTELDNLYSTTMPSSTRDFMPQSCADPSPFIVRARGRVQDESPQVSHRNVIGGQPLSPDDSSDDDSSSDDDRSIQSPFKMQSRDPLTPDLLGLEPLSMFSQKYVVEPSANDLHLYHRYAEISKMSSNNIGNKRYKEENAFKWESLSEFTEGSTLHVEPPTVDTESRTFYHKYCEIARTGPSLPSDQHIYNTYVSQKYLW